MSVFIVTRTTRSGEKRYHVRWQRGRAYPQVHLGSFKTLTAARKRRDWAENEIAAGRFPDRYALDEQLSQTLGVTARAYTETRIDLAENTMRSLRQSVRLIERDLGSIHPARLSVDRVQAWVVSLSERYKPGTITLHVGALASILDYARVTPNPARDPRVRKPRRRREARWLPTRVELERVYTALPERYVLVVRLIEATGLRIHEVVALEWGDLEPERRRLLVRDSKTSSGTRWVDDVDVPEKPEGATGRVFDLSAAAVASALQYHAARKLGLRVTPHTLRHLYASRAIHAGVNPVIVAERLGHANPHTTWSFYVHLPPPD